MTFISIYINEIHKKTLTGQTILLSNEIPLRSETLINPYATIFPVFIYLRRLAYILPTL